ncbi:COX8 domain-containing protein [Ictalurus punctatus]|uniref:COX8 domain-containing protein n=1 Tax=Ictalurus punctatus TaxID=7998 RepID=A0A2D0PZE1_ICTPU|nr:COX8 domain-containing protein [Ictalurus punctatus]
MLEALRRTSRTMQLRNVSRSRVVLQNRSGSIYSKPPKTKIGPGQTFFIMSVFAIALLLPAGWILHHLPEYRHRPPAPPS